MSTKSWKERQNVVVVKTQFVESSANSQRQEDDHLTDNMNCNYNNLVTFYEDDMSLFLDFCIPNFKIAA
jgi:hypothetical protein